MDSVRARLDAWVARSRTPGLHYRVVGPAGVVFAHQAGAADLRRAVPMTPGTSMMAYSMSKTFTAATVLGLVRQGRLDLDRPLGESMEMAPGHARVTVRQLLSHTSGLGNPIPLRWVHAASAHDTFDEAAALAEVLRRHGRLVSPPGARYRYSNIGYWLLGRVVEQATGAPFMDELRARVLEPLGLGPADLGDRIPDPARHATGYLERYSFMNLVKGLVLDRALVGEPHGPWQTIRPHYVNGPAFGGLVGNADAFARFLQDQAAEQSSVLDEPTREQFFEEQRDSAGRPVAMTLGWHVGRLGPSSPFYYKEGGGGGFHCMMRLYRSRRVGTLMMVNATGFDVGSCLDALDPAFLA